eukprot:380085_1
MASSCGNIVMKLITTAKNRLKKQIQTRLSKRISSMETIINERIPSTARHFQINETTKKLICNTILNKIDKYNGSRKLQNKQQDTQKKCNSSRQQMVERTQSIA